MSEHRKKAVNCPIQSCQRARFNWRPRHAGSGLQEFRLENAGLHSHLKRGVLNGGEKVGPAAKLLPSTEQKKRNLLVDIWLHVYTHGIIQHPPAPRKKPLCIRSRSGLHLTDDKSCIPDVQYYLCAALYRNAWEKGRMMGAGRSWGGGYTGGCWVERGAPAHSC